MTPPGSDSADTTGVYTISGGGPDIYDHADAFHFVSQPVEGDWVFVARLTSLQKTDDWAKAGLMVRQNTTPGSLEVMIAQSAAKGVSFQFRDLPNARTDAFTYNNAASRSGCGSSRMTISSRPTIPPTGRSGIAGAWCR